ncbi:transposable element Tcb1 transposase [Trichonephila clavipes]|nr:transposable element Tcb1 transposase [Trichonephila clavipes]
MWTWNEIQRRLMKLAKKISKKAIDTPRNPKRRPKRSLMSRRKQRSAFDQVSEFDRGRIVAYRHYALSLRQICSRVRQKQTTVMRICDRWMQECTTDRRG